MVLGQAVVFTQFPSFPTLTPSVRFLLLADSIHLWIFPLLSLPPSLSFGERSHPRDAVAVDAVQLRSAARSADYGG